MENNDTPNPSDPYGNDQEGAYSTIEKVKPSLNTGSVKVVFGFIALILFAVYMLNSIFNSAPPQEGVDLTGGLGGGRGAKIAKDKGTGEETAGLVLSTPTKSSLQSPPVEDTGFSPPPPLPTDETTTEQSGKDSVEIPPPPPLPPVDRTADKVAGTNNKDMQKRIRAGMLVLNTPPGPPAAADAANSASQSLSRSDPNRAFYDQAIGASVAEKAKATRVSNLGMSILQGKVIYAVLETAIDTTLPGTIRAIVSRDTYAETGRNVIIPKGSRLIGTYNTGVLHGQARVMIVWTRLIRPDGIDIQIGSPAVDGLGRAGVIGFANERYMEIFSAAILTTALTLGAATATEAVIPGSGTTTTSAGGDTTTTTTPAQQAAADGVSNLSDISEKVIDRIVDIRPQITIDQGTRINVFVNKDLTLPNDSDSSMFIR